MMMSDRIQTGPVAAEPEAKLSRKLWSPPRVIVSEVEDRTESGELAGLESVASVLSS
jgi:hypothetical protein